MNDEWTPTPVPNAQPTGVTVERCRIDGGWLYITTVRTVGVSTAYVPDPVQTSRLDAPAGDPTVEQRLRILEARKDSTLAHIVNHGLRIDDCLRQIGELRDVVDEIGQSEEDRWHAPPAERPPPAEDDLQQAHAPFHGETE